MPSPTGPSESSLVPERLSDLVARASARIRVDPSCLAHVRIRTARGEKDVLFGPRASIDAEPSVLDARTAPLANLLYDLEPGEDYELDAGSRSVEGMLIERHLLEVQGAELVAIHSDTHSLRRLGGAFVAEPPLLRIAEPPRASPRSGFGLEVELDADQRAAVDADGHESMLVTGSAGAGKTTVALARVVRLARAASAAGDATFRGMYVTPTEALARWVTLALERASVDGVEVISFDALATRLARRAFRKLPRRVANDAGAGTLRVKRHPALAAILARLVDARPVEQDEPDDVHRAGAGTREDLLHLFGDPALLAGLLVGDASVLPSDLTEVVARTRAQFRGRTEDEFADVVDATKLDALDGRSLDAGTPDDDAGRIDVEDFPVVFEIARLRAERRGSVAELPESVDVLVVDEAQELATLELRLLRRLVKPGGSIVVAGDEGQRTEVGAFFESFDAILHELGVPDARRAVLATSYRCPPDVALFAQALRDRVELLPVAGSLTTRTFARELHLVVWVAAWIRRIREGDSHASIAIVARERSTASRIGLPLAAALDADVRLDGRFDFRRRLVVTTIAEVRGLEFDHVALVDLDRATYPDDDLARRALYLGVTRACASAALTWVGTRSAILAAVETTQK